jgi:hypothetical protein
MRELGQAITDCRVVGSPDVVVTVDSWRGVQTVSLPMPRFRHNGLGWSVATADDPEGIGATRYLADLVCGVGECGSQLCHRDTIGTGRRSTFGVSARTGGFAVRAMIRTCGWSSARRGGDVKGRTFPRKIDSP